MILKCEFDKDHLNWLESLAPANRDAMVNQDKDALRGLSAYDTSRQWAVTNTGSLIMSYIFRETLKNYEKYGDIPWLNYDVLKNSLGKIKINEGRMRIVMDAFKEYEFIETNEKKIKSLDKDKTKLSLRIRLTDMWKWILKEYKRNKKHTIIYPDILGRQIYMSYLVKYRDELKLPTGISSFKPLLMILHSATKDGYIDSKYGEDMFYEMGKLVKWHGFVEGDEIKKEEIKFFLEDDCKNKKINPLVMKAYNKYLAPNQIKITNVRNQGLV